MKTVRRILIIILAIVLVLILIGFILPKKVSIKRSLVIKGSQENIFEQVNIVKYWEKWSPWHKIDSAMKIQYSGPESGNGAAYDWQSDNGDVGNGRLEIISSIPFDSILMLMDFGADGKSSLKFTFTKADTGILVTWQMDSNLGNNPISRWFGVFMDWMVGSDFEKGLKNISKVVAEATAKGIQVVETEVPERMILSIRDTASIVTINAKFGNLFGKLSKFMKLNSLPPTGAPLIFYHNYTPESFDMEVAMPIANAVPVAQGILFTKLAATKSVMVKYFGAYNAIAPVYDALHKYMNDKGLSIAGPPWEEYITDPYAEPDTAKWQTNVYFPVK